MSPRMYMAAAVRVLGAYVLALAAMQVSYFLPDLIMRFTNVADNLPLIVGSALVMAAFGFLFLRQSRWIAGVAPAPQDGAIEQPLTHGALRAFAFGLVGCVAAIGAIRRVARYLIGPPSEPSGIELVQPYIIAGYTLVAIGVLVGPLRVLRAIRGLPARDNHWSTSPIEVRELELLARRGLCLWFAVLALTNAVQWTMESRWRFHEMDASSIASIVMAGVLSWIFARTGRLRGNLRSPTSQLAFEIVAVTLLLVIVPSVAAYLHADTWGTWVRQLDAPAATPITHGLVVLISIGLLTWAYWLRRHGPPSLPTVLD